MSTACSRRLARRHLGATGGCGNLEIRGSYGANLTFTAENDILITEDITRATGSEALLG